MSLTETQPAHTIIFMHLPKTGGKTLSRVIEKQYPRHQIYLYTKPRPDSLRKFESMTDAQKAAYRLFHGHMDFGLHNICHNRRPISRFCANRLNG